MKVISASRRTDIPAFYSEWFMNRIRAGHVRWRNARSGINYTVSLRPEDVGAIVFRSKNYLPLLPHLGELDERGYGLVFHLTITGLPRIFEPNVPDLRQLLDCARTLADGYCRTRCSGTVIRTRSGELATAIEGLTSRCYFSYLGRRPFCRHSRA